MPKNTYMFSNSVSGKNIFCTDHQMFHVAKKIEYVFFVCIDSSEFAEKIEISLLSPYFDTLSVR